MNRLFGIIVLVYMTGLYSCGERCERIEGPRERFERPLDFANSFELNTPADVFLQKGDSLPGFLEIIAQPEVFNGLITEVEDQHCMVDLDDCFKGQLPVLINGTLSALHTVNLYSAGKITTSELIEEDSVLIRSDGLGDVDLLLKSAYIESRIYSSGNIVLSGDAGYLKLRSLASGELSAFNLYADTVFINTYGTSIIEVYASNYLKINFGNPTTVRYRGNPDSIIVEGDGNVVNANF